MQKKDITNSLRRHADGGEFITKTGIAKTMGLKKSEYAQKYIRGLQAIDGKYYAISEVADNMMTRLR